MGEKVLLCAPFVRSQGIIKDYLEVGGLVGGGCGCRVSMGHNNENEEFVYEERRILVAGSWEWRTPPRQVERSNRGQLLKCG